MLIKLQLFFVFLIAPFIGLVLAVTLGYPFASVDIAAVNQEQERMIEYNQDVKQGLFNQRELLSETHHASLAANQLLEYIQTNAHEELQEYIAQREKLDSLVEASVTYQQNSADLIERLLATMLGDPIDQTYGENSIVKVYSLQEAGYRGFMAKVRLHNPNAIRMVLAEDKVASQGETTSQAGRRTGAVLAINAGGFTSQDGSLYPIGITVIDGEVVTFYDTSYSLIGFNENGNLVGGQVSSREEIQAMGVQHGASFVPTLLKDGKKQPIPASWANTRQPRTLIGHFENGDLFFMVIDGRREGWSHGVTLEDAQEKLIEFNIRDAYNLDGGGSSAFYYDGQVLNRPSDGRERRVTTNIVVMP
ncbi:phosphodiester glycosidase family protein [Desertibacillus haloalkaliphilus]|uniref:phosphodiester glycosidase family protein n=1 Tax=Desertibacillus haloalkaliphilus TaxID=1328930 RepID=UPI001C266981|nr:phosphodiester glycosidase family protein [Desertibacillus haloalkaliphilus]MBU8907904.1 phosphodiester glycosidase family protein [Desertibacillus haloalkaliphilus]